MLSQLSEFIATRMGLHFPKERWRELERGITAAAVELGFKTIESCLRWLTLSPARDQVEILASYLTVGETYFFREPSVFEILQRQILPALMRSRQETVQRLRIWSAGCATGEEPYSIAILLNRMIPDLEDWNVTILATDINPRFLRKAEEGVYGEWSFREIEPTDRRKHFKKCKDGRLEVLPHLKRIVAFSYLNLAEDEYPSLWNNTNAIDLIFCRNVLMYFASDRAKKVIGNLHRSLVDDGWLVVGAPEYSHVPVPKFTAVNFPDAILYRKAGDMWENGQDVSPQGYEEPAGFPPLSSANLIPQSEAEGAVSRESCLPSSDFAEGAQEIQPSTPHAEAFRCFQQGRYTDAIHQLHLALSHNSNDAEALVLLARVYANQGRLAEALACCERGIAADKLNPGGHYLHANILQELGAIEQATQSLKRTLYVDPNFILAHFSLGSLALRQVRVSESRKHFNNALSLLQKHGQGDILPHCEGMTVGRLKEIIRANAPRGTMP